MDCVTVPAPGVVYVKERQRDRQRDRETEKCRDTKTEIETESGTESKTEEETESKTEAESKTETECAPTHVPAAPNVSNERSHAETAALQRLMQRGRAVFANQIVRWDLRGGRRVERERARVSERRRQRMGERAIVGENGPAGCSS